MNDRNGIKNSASRREEISEKVKKALSEHHSNPSTTVRSDAIYTLK